MPAGGGVAGAGGLGGGGIAGAGGAVAGRGVGTAADPVAGADPEAALRRRYEAYLSTQAAALPTILPREAVRPLYREAVARARRRGEPLGKDPMQTLVAYCRELLPLPPYEVWRRDFTLHREAHLSDPTPRVSTPPPPGPVVTDVRAVVFGGVEWSATLSLHPDDETGWRGFVTFQAGPEGPSHRTADIFAEPDPSDIRARFAGFATSTLEAFLRSVLPD